MIALSIFLSAISLFFKSSSLIGNRNEILGSFCSVRKATFCDEGVRIVPGGKGFFDDEITFRDLHAGIVSSFANWLFSLDDDREEAAKS